MLLRTDLFEKITGEFDLIVANLPYIPTGELAALSREVQSDPRLALDGGADGLDLVRRFAAEVGKHLAADGLIALEVGHDQGDATAALLMNAEVQSDLQGVRRFVLGSAIG